MGKLNEIINNIVSNVLEEELAIASDVSNGTKQLTNALIAAYKNDSEPNDKETFRDDESGFNIILPTKTISVKENLNTIGGIRLYANIVYFKDYDSFDEYWNSVDMINSVDGNTIYCTLFCIDNVLSVGLLTNILSHELEHMYQTIKSNNNIVGKEYHKAKMILTGKDTYHASNEYKIVAYVFYYLQIAEINANVNGLYGEMIDRKETIMKHDVRDSVKRSMFYNEYNNTFLPYYRYIVNNMDNNEIVKAVNYFGFKSMESFMKYVNKQRKYLNSKFMKVLQKLSNDINEGKIFKKAKTLKVKPDRLMFNDR